MKTYLCLMLCFAFALSCTIGKEYTKYDAAGNVIEEGENKVGIGQMQTRDHSISAYKENIWGWFLDLVNPVNPAEKLLRLYIGFGGSSRILAQQGKRKTTHYAEDGVTVTHVEESEIATPDFVYHINLDPLGSGGGEDTAGMGAASLVVHSEREGGSLASILTALVPTLETASENATEVEKAKIGQQIEFIKALANQFAIGK